ncbi:MAG: hypothetical protein DBX38_01860 [Eubacteriales Family XIII. Incertae Sedis bacterium]|nr:MAG: hypothetical protein DBX38_01860 [Clostridiales Family XIII bacterium]
MTADTAAKTSTDARETAVIAIKNISVRNMEKTAYTLIRSQRKTLSLLIRSDGALIARAPLYMPIKEIEAFIEKKKEWIDAKQYEAKLHSQKYKKITAEPGAMLPYLGRMRKIIKCETDKVYLKGTELFISSSAGADDLIKWLKESALALFKKRTDAFAEIMNTNYASVKISNAKTRWGSCSGSNSINFSWRLVMCPPEIIDYVVVHELAHTIHKNHSREFWNEVGAFIPDYKIRRKQLKEYSGLMDII